MYFLKEIEKGKQDITINSSEIGRNLRTAILIRYQKYI